MEGGERTGQEPAAASGRGEWQPVKPMDSPRGRVWGHQWHHHTQFHNVQKASPKTASAEGSRGEQGQHPLPGSGELGLEGRDWGCKHRQECGTH